MPVLGASRKTALSALPPAPKNLGPGMGTSEIPPRLLVLQGWTLACWTACHSEAANPATCSRCCPPSDRPPRKRRRQGAGPGAGDERPPQTLTLVLLPFWSWTLRVWSWIYGPSLASA